MKKLEINEAFAKQLYPSAGSDLKEALINTFGLEFFEKAELNEDYKKISSYETACEYEGVDPIDNLPYKNPATPRQHRMNNICILETAYEAMNKIDNFIPDYADENQEKWYGWVYYDPKASGFGGSYYAYSDSSADVCARLCVFRNSEIAKFFAEKFLPIVNKIYFSNH